MKIEKLSDNQIRCTLNKEDLASRQLKISELAYGSEKAKDLFQDMMQLASYELGFETNDIPLMIEAIPVSADCIVLIVTKVDDPEELDTRFSKFSSTDDDFDDFDYPYGEIESIDTTETNFSSQKLPTADEELHDTFSDSDKTTNPTFDMNSIFHKVSDYVNKPVASSSDNTAAPKKNENIPSDEENIIRIFSFDSLDTFTEAACAVAPIYSGANHLYKSPEAVYYLVLKKGFCNTSDFNKTCNILSEFGTKEPLSKNRLLFFHGHYECIIPQHAIQIMSRI